MNYSFLDGMEESVNQQKNKNTYLIYINLRMPRKIGYRDPDTGDVYVRYEDGRNTMIMDGSEPYLNIQTLDTIPTSGVAGQTPYPFASKLLKKENIVNPTLYQRKKIRELNIPYSIEYYIQQVKKMDANKKFSF